MQSLMHHLKVPVTRLTMDLDHLPDLISYICSGFENTNGNNVVEKNDRISVILSELPKLQHAMNTKTNIFARFCELDPFSEIPNICDVLRVKLNTCSAVADRDGAWGDKEFSIIRDVCMEHVKLESLLLKSEAGMKTWLDFQQKDGAVVNDKKSAIPLLKSNHKKLRQSQLKQGRTDNEKGNLACAGDNTTSICAISSHHQAVDNFLSHYAKNVCSLGTAIQGRILSEIDGSIFHLAMNHPQKLTAFVEVFDIYENERKKISLQQNYHETTISTNKHLLIANMKAAVLTTLCTDFKLHALELFRSIHLHMQMKAAGAVEMKISLNAVHFNAVNEAATELITEIDIIVQKINPCFASHWHIDMLYNACVAHVCSYQIIQQIGGPEGQILPAFTVTQLLDLVAWVEFYRETIENSYPKIGQMHNTKRAYFDERPDFLFSGDVKRGYVEDISTDILTWTNNMLWDVHRRAQDEFLFRTRTQINELLTKVYSANHETYQTKEMRLITSLCEDVFSMVRLHLRIITERLTRNSELLVMAACSIFSQLRSTQMSSRDKFLKDLDTCCAAANDFQRMSESCEDMLHDLLDNHDFSEKYTSILNESCASLISLYSGDAVFAAQKAHRFIFEPIWEEIGDKLFSIEWETELTHNELAMKLTRTLDDYIADLKTFLDEFMLTKIIDALVTASVEFYIQCLLRKAEKHKDNYSGFFNNSSVALERMEKDVTIIKDYFDESAKDKPVLRKVIEKEFHVLTTVQELLKIAIGISNAEASDFIIVLHKRLKDFKITTSVVGDIWHLVQPTEERTVWKLTKSLEETLITVCPPDTSKIVYDRMNVPGLGLNETLAKHYSRSKRQRFVVTRKKWHQQSIHVINLDT